MSVYCETASSASIDPRYRYYKLLKQTESDLPAFLCVQEDMLPVVGKINNLELWNKFGGIRPGVDICDANGKDWIVTGRVAMNRFEALQQQDWVLSLEVAQVVAPYLEKTKSEIKLPSRQATPLEPPEHRGKGIIIGVVDYGLDFYHRNFIKKIDIPRKSSIFKRISYWCCCNKQPIETRDVSRILFIWNQSGSSDSTSPYGYGQLHSREDINQALLESDPYTYLGYDPEAHLGSNPKQESAHGTHVADIAAGSGKEPGIAPEADIAFVELSEKSRKKITKKGIQGEGFCNAAQVIEAVDYIFKRAGNTPCVINLSLGTHAGPHDGTSKIEQAFDRMLSSTPNRAIVVAAGNAYADRIHQSGFVPNKNFVDLEWELSFGNGNSEVQIWYSEQDSVNLTIWHGLTQITTASVSLGNNSNLWIGTGANRRFVGCIAHQKEESDNMICIIIKPSSLYDPTSHQNLVWKLRLFGEEIRTDGKFHSWIERDDANQTTFAHSDPSCTLGSISTAKKTIAVGAYSASDPDNPAWFSSAGPTRKGSPKPDVSAPGVDVWAAESKNPDRESSCQKSGTSMAAPVVTGLVGRILSTAHAQNEPLLIDQIREKIISNCQQTIDNTGQGSWHSQFGAGRVRAITHPLPISTDTNKTSILERVRARFTHTPRGYTPMEGVS